MRPTHRQVMASSTWRTAIIALILVLYSEPVKPYTLVHDYNYTNWYSSFTFEDVGTILEQLQLN